MPRIVSDNRPPHIHHQDFQVGDLVRVNTDRGYPCPIRDLLGQIGRVTSVRTRSPELEDNCIRVKFDNRNVMWFTYRFELASVTKEQRDAMTSFIKELTS